MTHDPQTPTNDFDPREAGAAPAGLVGLRNFDQGVV